jgi:N-acetylneuraminic acid mutarotase
MASCDGHQSSDGGDAKPRPEAGGWERLPEARFANGQGLGVGVPLNLAGDVVLIIGGSYEAESIEALAFDPVAKRWRRLPNAPVPWRSGYSAVHVDGSEAIVWGGSGGGDVPEGAVYNHRRREWRGIKRSSLGIRTGHAAAWTGEKMIVWGGEAEGFCGAPTPRTGAGYEPRLDQWRAITPAPIPGRVGAAAVWTGDRMIVWGGVGDRDGSCEPRRFFADGAAYDPRRDRWRSIPQAPIRSDVDPRAFWTGEEMLVWAGRHVALYEPTAERWRSIPAAPIEPRRGEVVVWKGGSLFVWGGVSTDERRVFEDGAVYNLERGTWRLLPDPPVSTGDGYAGTWTGRSILLLSPGCCRGRVGQADGLAFTPSG